MLCWNHPEKSLHIVGLLVTVTEAITLTVALVNKVALFAV